MCKARVMSLVSYICVYYYYYLITFCYKVSDLRKKIVKLVIIQTFDWFSKHLVYYLCMYECSCVRRL